MREVLYRPQLILLIFGLVLSSAAFHEFGHATACRYGGARPGAMGVGVYIAWPALFTDVTDAYRLGRPGRLRTDLGGIYFNAVFMVAVAVVYFLTGFEPLLIAIVVQHLEIVHQMMPFLRLDGYYVVSDLTGIPDLFGRIKPALSSLIPWKEVDPRVAELTTAARLTLIAWVLLLIPIVGGIFITIALTTPRLFATAAASVSVLATQAVSSVRTADFAGGSLAVLQIAALTLPLAGIVFTFARFARRLSSFLWRISNRNRLQRATAVVLLSGAGLIFLTGALSVDRTPIGPHEKGTLAEIFGGFSHPSGEGSGEGVQTSAWVPSQHPRGASTRWPVARTDTATSGPTGSVYTSSTTRAPATSPTGSSSSGTRSSVTPQPSASAQPSASPQPSASSTPSASPSQGSASPSPSGSPSLSPDPSASP